MTTIAAYYAFTERFAVFAAHLQENLKSGDLAIDFTGFKFLEQQARALLAEPPPPEELQNLAWSNKCGPDQYPGFRFTYGVKGALGGVTFSFTFSVKYNSFTHQPDFLIHDGWISPESMLRVSVTNFQLDYHQHMPNNPANGWGHPSTICAVTDGACFGDSSYTCYAIWNIFASGGTNALYAKLKELYHAQLRPEFPKSES